MLHSAQFRSARTLVPITVALSLCARESFAHEAWLLTPSEIEALASEPMPYIFTSTIILIAAALVGCAATAVALFADKILQPFERRFEGLVSGAALSIGPVVLRLGVAVMLALAGTGGLPRHGTAPWTQPTFFVPDMQLALVSGWDWIGPVQIGIAAFLLLGLFTRIIGLVLFGLSAVGLVVFGGAFMAYAPHFAAPGLILLAVGGGSASLDQRFGLDDMLAPPAEVRQFIWRLATVLFGAGFVYLAVAYKLTQPTLLIAIIQHGQMPTFGLSYAVIALVMTGVEIICGSLLIVGRLTRPVAFVIMGAITFLAVTLGETPLFHANLYGVMAIVGLGGRFLPLPAVSGGAKRSVLA
jgi:uncharacterized membrane protein YphA (DoxX/SURF4 family)